jgi:circadian clock protein KaiB
VLSAAPDHSLAGDEGEPLVSAVEPLAVREAKLGGGPLPTYVLKLYVTGTSPRAEVAISNLRRICEQELRGKYELEIIDVLERPQVAEDDKILATPTLIKQLPPPLRRVIGDLSDKEKVLLGLEVVRDATYSDPQHEQHDAS